jgi:hypothetical protein
MGDLEKEVEVAFSSGIIESMFWIHQTLVEICAESYLNFISFSLIPTDINSRFHQLFWKNILLTNFKNF